MLTPVPHIWHVIAGASQALPAGNGSTESVNQFFPRHLTIHPGDTVIFTDNSVNEPHTVTFGPDRLLRPLEDPRTQLLHRMVNGKAVVVFNPAVMFPSAHVSPGGDRQRRGHTIVVLASAVRCRLSIVDCPPSSWAAGCATAELPDAQVNGHPATADGLIGDVADIARVDGLGTAVMTSVTIRYIVVR